MGKVVSMKKLMEKLEKQKYSAENPADCPFCGTFDCELIEQTEFIRDNYVETFAVECKICTARGPFSEDIKKAWELWNKRKLFHPLAPQEH